MACRPSRESLDEFAASLVGMVHGDITVIDAVASYGSWGGDDEITVELRFSDPPEGQETWNVGSVHEIRAETRTRWYAAGFERWLVIEYTGRPYEEDDEDEEPVSPESIGIPPRPERRGEL